MTSPGGRRRDRHRRGQALVEFALMFPIFLMMLFGLIDAGRYIYMDSVVSQAAREAARLAAVQASWIGVSDPSCNTVGGPVCPATAADLKTNVLAAANRMVVPFGTIPSGSLYISCDDPGNAPTGAWTVGSPCTATSGASGQIVSVRLVLTFTPFTPFISHIGTLTTSGAATMVSN
ncbi:MAG TPA: TadE family protein [Candidatus Limnocylindrales bacterium]